MKINSLADILPIQDHYYLLHDGSRYAQHGTEEAHGLLIFSNLESAEQFCRTVGVGLPEFQPVRASVDEVFVLAIETGAICIAQGVSVIVASLSNTVHWIAKRRKTTTEKVRMDIKVRPPSKHIDDVYYVAMGKRSEFLIVAGFGDVLRPCPDGFEKIGNIFRDEEAKP